MKFLILIFAIGLFLGCVDEKEEAIVTLVGEVIGKYVRPPGGGLFGSSGQLIVYFKADTGEYLEIHIDPLFYELEDGDRIKMTCKQGGFYKYLGGDTRIIEDKTLIRWERTGGYGL